MKQARHLAYCKRVVGIQDYNMDDVDRSDRIRRAFHWTLLIPNLATFVSSCSLPHDCNDKSVVNMVKQITIREVVDSANSERLRMSPEMEQEVNHMIAGMTLGLNMIMRTSYQDYNEAYSCSAHLTMNLPRQDGTALTETHHTTYTSEVVSGGNIQVLVHGLQQFEVL